MNTTQTGDQWPWTQPLPGPFYPTPIAPPIKSKTTRTIEKWGPNGEYLGKEIITEEAWDEVPIPWQQPWSPIVYPYQVTCNGNTSNSSQVTASCTTLNDVNLQSKL